MSTEPTSAGAVGSRGVSTARQRMLAWLPVLVAGIAGLVLARRSGAHLAAVNALSWALLAAVAVSLLLRTAGRRVVAVLEIALAVGLALVVVLGEGHPVLLSAAALALVGAVLQLLWAPRWAHAATSRYERGTAPRELRTDLDVWKAMDAGLDPTGEDFGDSLAAQHTSPVTDRTIGTRDGADQEEQ